MKKHSLFLLFFSLFFTATFGQKICPGCSTPKDQWVYFVIQDENTQGFWLTEGINPDPKSSVDYGDSIPFFFEQHYHWTQPADSTGESPWSLIGDWYDTNVALPVIATADRDTTVLPISADLSSIWTAENFPDTLWWIFLFFLLLGLLFAFLNRKWLFERRPLVTEPVATTKETDGIATLTGENVLAVGPPVYQNGLADETVRMHFENEMAREGVNLPILAIYKGRLFSNGQTIPVAFKDFDRDARLNGISGYEAQVQLENGEVELRHTLQVCGNDLRRGENIPNVRFVRDSQQPAILQSATATDQASQATTETSDSLVDFLQGVQEFTGENAQLTYVNAKSGVSVKVVLSTETENAQHNPFSSRVFVFGH